MCDKGLIRQKTFFAENEANNALPPNSTRSNTELIFLSHNRFTLKGKENSKNLNFVSS